MDDDQGGGAWPPFFFPSPLFIPPAENNRENRLEYSAKVSRRLAPRFGNGVLSRWIVLSLFLSLVSSFDPSWSRAFYDDSFAPRIFLSQGFDLQPLLYANVPAKISRHVNASAIEFTCDLPLRNFHFDFHGVLFADEYFKGGEKYRGLFYFFFSSSFHFFHFLVENMW